MADPVISRQVMVSVDVVVDVDSSLPNGSYSEEARHVVELRLNEAMQDHNEFSAANITNYIVTGSDPILTDEEWMAWIQAEYPEPTEG